jgi:hypothetical protein
VAASCHTRRAPHRGAPTPPPTSTPPGTNPIAPSAPGSQSGQTTTPPGHTTSPATTSSIPVGGGWEGFGNGAWPSAEWRPYAASSPFNTTVAGDAVVPQSAEIVSKVLSFGLPGTAALGVAETSEDWMHPVYYSEPGDPVYTLQSTEPWGKDPINGMQIPIPAGARPAGGSDGHMAVVTPEGWEYDFWQVSSKGTTGGTMTFAWGNRSRIDGSGTGGEATASGFDLLAGVIRPQELEAGQINHALFIVLKCTSRVTTFGYGAQVGKAGDASGSFVYPAEKGGSPCAGGSETNVPPMGTRFALAMSEAQIEALALPAWKKAILRALANYGGYVGDTGGPGFGVQFESGSSYTSLGLPDPWVTFAQRNHLPTSGGRYALNLSEGVEWQRYLRVLAPPAS